MIFPDFFFFCLHCTLCIFNYQTSKSLWSSEVLTGDARTLSRTVVIESSHSETSLTAGICTTASPLSSICFFDVAAHLQTLCLRCNITACTWSHARRTHPCKSKTFSCVRNNTNSLCRFCLETIHVSASMSIGCFQTASL